MKIEKQVIANLTKCYSVAPLQFRGNSYFLVAAEKQDPCYLFDMEGHKVDTIWEGPGGVMSMVQVPGSDGIFLATQKFYSPNDSKEAEIAVVMPKGESWQVKTLVKLPHVHRFDILTRNGVNYLVACTLKSGHAYKNDWSSPGKIYAAVLPEHTELYEREENLKLEILKENLLKNHGYCRIVENGVEEGLIASVDGIFRVIPPETKVGNWQIEQLSREPASDAVLVDMDEDGEKELIYISPFHGNKICFCRKAGDTYQQVYCYDHADFAHAIYGGELLGKPAVVIGHREGSRDLLLFTYQKDQKQYQPEILDHGCGSANVYRFAGDEKDILISANRETNEVAMYTLTE